MKKNWRKIVILTLLPLVMYSCSTPNLPSETPEKSSKSAPKTTITSLCPSAPEIMNYFNIFEGKKLTYNFSTTPIQNLIGSSSPVSESAIGLMSLLNGEISIEILELKGTTYKQRTTITMAGGQPQTNETTEDICKPPKTDPSSKEEMPNFIKLGEETITVPAGSFKCIKFSATDKNGTIINIWVSEQIGFYVKMSSKTKEGIESNIELKSYK